MNNEGTPTTYGRKWREKKKKKKKLERKTLELQTSNHSPIRYDTRQGSQIFCPFPYPNGIHDLLKYCSVTTFIYGLSSTQ